MKYFLFIDESGDHGLKTIDPNSPVFVLCGVLIAFDDHAAFVEQMYALKNHFWRSKEVIFHSRDIRKCEKEFSILLDLNVKKAFYDRLNAVVAGCRYTVISAAVNKDAYIKRYGRSGNVYAIALSFIIERTVFFLDSQEKAESVQIIVEKRGKREDDDLLSHYNRVISLGTYYVNAQRIKNYNMTMRFKAKKENINWPAIVGPDRISHR